MTDLMDLPYRPEALSVGDDIQWLGERHTIVAKLPHYTGTVFRLDDGREVFYRPGGWITAWPQGVVA